MPASPERGFSVLEVMVALVLFSVMSLISVLCVQQVSSVWRSSSSRDLALRELLKAESALQRDLGNISKGSGQSLVSAVQAGSGSVVTGDALAMILPPADQQQLALSSQGTVVMDRLVTYYLAVPAQVDSLAGLPQTFVGDAQGHEQQCGYKWLVRRESPAPAGSPGLLAAIPANWFGLGVVEVPTQLWREPHRKVVAINLLQFRVTEQGPIWEVTLTAVALEDARRKLALGSVPLAGTRYAISHRVAAIAQN